MVRVDVGRFTTPPPSRLEARGRVGSPKVIIVAVMQKMITTLNAMLRDNAPWQPKSA
jgi:hypothetical protein